MAKKSTSTDKKKAPTKKVAAKKTTPAKATKPAKKSAAKKAPAKKVAVKKVAAKKTPAKKAVAKKVAVKKAPAKKVAAKKVATKSALKVAIKPARPTGGKVPAKKVVAKTAVKADKKAVSKVKLSESEILKNAIVEGMEERKAENIVVMDLREVKNAVADFFVICQAESTTQVDAIANSVWDEVYKTTKEKPWHLEGKDNKQWILVDYVSVVAHIFQPEARSFYNLEKLWNDAEFKYIVH